MGAAAEPLDPRLLLTTLDEGTCAVPEHIAQRTGVPEAQVVEALEGMERAGFVVREDGERWALPPRSTGELRELHVVAALLEGLALRTCPRMGPEELTALRAANDALRGIGPEDLDGAIAADDAFHGVIVDACGNADIRRIHGETRAALMRYERDFWLMPGYIERSTGQHEAIIAALDEGDTARATALIRENFTSALSIYTERFGP